LAKVTVTPDTFELIEFDHDEIQAIAEEMATKCGLGDDVEIDIDIDEAVMMPQIDVGIDGRKATLKVSGGALEDQRQARHLSPERARLQFGTYFFRFRDRFEGGFDGVPPHPELSVQHSSAWDTYTEGRLARLGLPARPQRRLYHFRLRHGFSDGIDAIFDRLWNGENLTWADIQAACDEASTLKAQLEKAPA
jgi:hypothetical protein